MKISVLQSVATADKSCAKERMLRSGLDPPRVDQSPPEPLQPRSNAGVRSVLPAGFKIQLPASLIPSGRSWVPAGLGERAEVRRTSQELSPCSGTGLGERAEVCRTCPHARGQCRGHGPWRGRCQHSCAGGRAAAVPCLASPHLSGIRCSIAGNSQRIPALNCSRLSSFSQGLSRCVGDAG